MPAAKERELPRWPLRLVLSLLLVLEVFFTLMLSMEGLEGNIPMLVNSVALIVFGVLTWRGVPLARWLVLALIVWRVTEIGVAAASHGPGDHRLGGSLILMVFYVVVASLVASPFGRASKRAAA